MSDPVIRVLAATGAALCAAALILELHRWAQLPPPRAAPPASGLPAALEATALEDLRQALAAAARACPCAAGLPDRRGWSAVLEALAHNPRVLEQEAGELPGLQREADWLAAVAAGAPLGRRSAEDRRYLHGFLHWYLDALYAHALRGERGEGALPAPELRHGPVGYDPLALREFRGLSNEDLLGLLD